MDKLTTGFKEYLYERLQDPEAAAEYLNAAFEGDDASSFLIALRLVAEARGIAQVAQQAELNRESLYKMLSDQGNPRLSSMLAVFEALELQIQVRPVRRSETTSRGKVTPILVETQGEQEESVVAQLSHGEHEHEYGSACPSKFKPVAA